MIRITVVRRQDKIRVVVEGRIARGCSAELSDACFERLRAGDHLALDLSGVTFVDRDGVTLVRDLLKQGCVLEECSELVRALVGNQSRQSLKPNGAHRQNELEILVRLRAGDEDAFELVVQRYGGRMLATARRFLHDEHDAQDAVQEAFASAFRALDKFNGEAMLSTWLHRIVVNAALLQLRSKKRGGEQPIETFLPRFDQDGEWMDHQLACTEATESILERRDSREMVRRCIERLPHKYRSVLVLRDIEELDTDETAQYLAVTANTVKVRLHRARQALKALIEREPLLRTFVPSDAAAS
ncbi:MAG: sigma-70 family RNA polymerase sigma factor [Deltaproteobacteria bacterium]|nr:sigma-70 family RNA polymerase sigma factor [Deltaproteobacteria bacterium]